MITVVETRVGMANAPGDGRGILVLTSVSYFLEFYALWSLLGPCQTLRYLGRG
jgi:hypothetical protein